LITRSIDEVEIEISIAICIEQAGPRSNNLGDMAFTRRSSVVFEWNRIILDLEETLFSWSARG
jgi:hypothetical protein